MRTESKDLKLVVLEEPQRALESN